MDNKITFSQLKEKIKNFSEERDWDQFHSPKDLSIAIATEASELLELFRFKNDLECELLFDDSKRRNEIEEELADILIMALRFSQKNNIDLSDAIIKKIEKNTRNYPVEISKGSNRKYTELSK